MDYKKTLTPSQAKEKIVKYCAYQERSHAEVKKKLLSIGLPYDDCDEVLIFLMCNNFLNEERFGKTFAGGKFRTKGWGKIKLKQELKLKGLNDKLIEKSFASEISDEDYEKKLLQLLEKKMRLLKESDKFKRKQKLINYALQKGYEMELILKKVDELF